MLRLILEDLRHKAAWYELPWSWKTGLRMLLSDGTTCQILYRLMQCCQRRIWLKPLAMILYRFNAFWCNAVIGRNAEFGPGLIILHNIGIVVNSQVKAGRNLVLEHGVTIGAEKNRIPVLGDNVFIGAGAKIIGGVTIGSDVKIGANAVVTKDLPDGATAVGIPAKVVRIYGQKIAETSADSAKIERIAS